MKNKRLCILLSICMIFFLLTSCSNDEFDIHVLENQNTKPEYLSLFSHESISDSDVTKYWSDCFTEKYNKRVYIDFDNASYYDDAGLSYRELLERRMNSSAPDDLYIISAEDVLDFEKKGYWLDLSGMDFIDNLSEAALYQSTYNGKVFSIPLTFTGFGFLWNVDLLAKYGLSVPENLTEFLNVCETLKNNGILPYAANKGFGLTVPVMCVGFSDLYRSENIEERIAALNSGESLVSDYVRDGFEFLSMMIENGYMNAEQAINFTPHQEDKDSFLAEECAFICTAVYNRNWDEFPFKVQLTGLPVLPDGCIAVYGAANRLCVNPESKHMETALEFIKMVSSPEALEKSAEIENAISTSKNSSIDRFTVERDLVSLLIQPGQIPNQDFSLHFNTWEKIRDAARQFCSTADIDSACALLDAQQQAELSDYAKTIR